MMEVIASMLEVCLEGTKKTHIMYRANISNDPLNSYLELLIDSGMLEKNELYRTTVKGRIYLEHFRGIVILLRKEESGEPASTL